VVRPTGINDRPDWPVALVVGTGGMGMAIARRLGQRHRLILTSRSADKLEAHVSALLAEGHDVIAVPCDITDPGAVERLGARVAAHGPLGTVAHVAALSPSMADWRTLMTINLVGAALIEREMLRLADQGTAAVFVSSLAAHMIEPPSNVVSALDQPLDPKFWELLEAAQTEPWTSSLAYRLSKWALNRICRRAAARWGAKGARILSMSPGLIATPMGALEFKNTPRKVDLLERTPLKREGTMLEMADVVEFLASDRASFITGTDILVDGGIGAVLQHPAQ
jgi:NAD(P)-dependent dehydrogenase (short-subunit alcohol dehydrogenase family)